MVVANPSDTLTLRILDHLRNNLTPGQAMEAVLPYLGQQLQCDRVFVYLRHPDTRRGRVPFCWRRGDEVPLVYDPHWKLEPESLEADDPMFAAALALAPSIFVKDVETAGPHVLNRQFEQENFGHRALIHAHLSLEGQLWGVLQPCVFNAPRAWTPKDHILIQRAVAWFTPFALEYVLKNSPHHDC